MTALIAALIDCLIRILIHAAMIYFCWRWSGISEWSGLKEIPWSVSLFLALLIDMFRVEKVECTKDE